MPRGELHDAAAAGVEEQAYWDWYANELEEEHKAWEQHHNSTAHLAVDFSWMDGMTVDELELPEFELYPEQ